MSNGNSANIALTESRKCTRCRRSTATFRPVAGRRICEPCRGEDKSRYQRDKGRITEVKRAYYRRCKRELPHWEFQARRLRTQLRNPDVTAEWLRELWRAQGGKCALTGRPLSFAAYELDHIVPRKRGGSNELSNFQFVCPEANHAKNDMLQDEFVALCRDVVGRFKS